MTESITILNDRNYNDIVNKVIIINKYDFDIF